MEVLNKILLGITLAAPIGPVSIEMIKRGLRDGFISAFIVRLGASIGNFICLLVAYYGLLQLKETQFVIIGFSLLASLMLIYKAYHYIFITNSISLNSSNNIYNKESNNNAILIGLYLAIANPIAFIFWSGIMTNSSNAFDTGLLFNSLIIVGVIIWGAIFSLFLSLGRNYVNSTTLLLVNKISGMVMMYYGLKFLWDNTWLILAKF